MAWEWSRKDAAAHIASTGTSSKSNTSRNKANFRSTNPWCTGLKKPTDEWAVIAANISPNSAGAVAPPPSTKSTLPMGGAASFDGATVSGTTTVGLTFSIKSATDAVCDAISSSSSVGTT